MNTSPSLPTPATSSVQTAVLKPNGPERKWKSWRFPPEKPRFTLTGYSRSADKTFFHIPELQFALDAGMCRGRQPKYVFLTHTHTDHSVDAPYMTEPDTTTLYCPDEVTDVVKEYVRSMRQLNWAGPIPEAYRESGGRIVGVKAGQSFLIKEGQYRVKVIQCFHSIPCVGYAFEERKKKLKAEFVGMPGKELSQLRKGGQEIEEEYYVPLFVYLGDTSVEVYRAHPELFDYPFIITECTFLPDPKPEYDQMLIERADRDGHIHWSRLQEIVLAHPRTTFVLIHFSLRLKEDTVHEFFDSLSTRAENPLPLNNVVVFIGEHKDGLPDTTRP